MKKIGILVLSFVLAACVMSACRENSNGETSEPGSTVTTKPSSATTVPSTAPTTEATDSSGSDMPGNSATGGNNDTGRTGRNDRRL